MKYSEHFRVRPGQRLRLKDIDPDYTAQHEHKATALEKILEDENARNPPSKHS